MTRDDIQKLLGGYATGTLTPEEQRALFEAALNDQELFDALAREESLRDVLSDGAARAHLLAALDHAPARWYRAWWRPMVVMAAALVVVAGVAVWERSREPKPLQVAKAELPRFQPPLAAPGTPLPALPPPPEVKTPRPVLKPLPLSEPAAVPPPPRQFGRTLAAPMFAPAQASPPAAQPSQQPSQQSQQTDRLQQVQALASPAPPPVQTPVPVHGIVTDAGGATVASAKIAVKSLIDGTVVNTSTNERGEFSVSEVPGNTYEISASKLGFKTDTVRDIPPLDGSPAPVSLKLMVASTADSVEVMETNSVVVEPRAAKPMGAGLAGARKQAATMAPAASYELLRIVPGSDPVPVPPGGSVPVGSSLTLRITPAADGFLRIADGKRTIANPQVTHGVVSETPLPAFDKRGRVELKVYFSSGAGESKQSGPALTVAFRVR